MSIIVEYEKLLDKDVFYTREEVEKQYGQSIKKNIALSLVVKDEKIFLEYKEKDLIVINESENKRVSKKLIHDLLNDEGMYKYLLLNLNNDLGVAARIDFIIDQESIVSIKITRKEFINALNQINDELSRKEQMRSAIIKSSWRQFSCEQRYRNATYNLFIDNTSLEIPVNTLIRIFTLSDENFKSFLAGNISFGYAKEILAYALVDFIERERILIKYDFPDNLIERYENIKNFSLIDFESLNKNLNKNDLDENGESIIGKITISDELREYLNHDLNPRYSNLEKAIYFYIKLCEIFSLDSNYYLAMSQEILEINQNIENIKSKNLSNNDISLYAFLTIFASLISELNIDFTLAQSLMNGEDLGKAKLTFRYGEYLVAINSLVTPEKSDFINVKVKDKIINLISINNNNITNKKFTELRNKVYEDIKRKRENRKSFQESLASYRDTFKYSKIDIQDKLYILLKEITRTNLKGLDMVGYEKKLFRALFANNSNVAINILAKKNGEEEYLTPVTVVSIRDIDYHYLVVDETNQDILRSVSLDELISLLSNNCYYYIDNKENSIPGVSRYVGDKIVR